MEGVGLDGEGCERVREVEWEVGGARGGKGEMGV